MILLAAVLSAAATLDAASTRNNVRRASPWHRVLFDDFSHGLRRSLWGVYSGQPGGDPGGWWAPSHAVVAHGVLNLETYRDPRYGGRWVSAGISSAPGLRQTYGKYEVRARLDRGRGVAFVALLWPVGNVWPPEIDFAEDGGETNARNHVTATLHYGVGDSQLQRAVRVNLTRWHTLGVEWLPGKLIYMIDGRAWATLRSPAVPDQPMEMDVQTQAGTCGVSYAPCPDAATPSHVDAQIKWVAAYAYRAA
ncbi:MAG: glycoside hydrolase family 16 protein [Solirubrobacteraceae bacterium]